MSMTPGPKMVWRVREDQSGDWSADRKKRRDTSRRLQCSPQPSYQGNMLRDVLLQGRVHQLAREPHSSRMLQREIRELDAATITTVVQEAAPHFCSLMADAVGNYFCQAVLEACSADDLALIVQYASQEIVTIALSRHGTCALQKLLVQVTELAPQLMTKLLDGLRGSVVKLTKDSYGHYVMECLLDLLEFDQTTFIVEAMRGHCAQVGTHRQGCLVLQKCFHRPTDAALVALGEEIAEHAVKLAQDPFGNYVVQNVLSSFKGHEVQNKIAKTLEKEIVK